MQTPICDFVRRYREEAPVRLHMPGHKGQGPLGVEGMDITEIDGADSLYEAEGIIRRSEAQASALFGCPTFYSTEGSSQCIRAMLYLALLHAGRTGRSPRILAGRNAHKTFLSAAALLDLQVQWIYPAEGECYLSCGVDGERLEQMLRECDSPPAAVYVTSPDYLGRILDLETLARVCHRYGVLLLVDNAHGAYLRFLPRSLHPMDLGADLCCDSAHKTLPVLTGGAYLHGKPALVSQARQALALFGSTSPSYLILQSLDAANVWLESLPEMLRVYVPQVQRLKEKLRGRGYALYGDEPLKVTICPKSYGYTGQALAQILRQQGIVCEFADPDYLVLMMTPSNGTEDLERVGEALCAVAPGKPLTQTQPRFSRPEAVLSIRAAALSPAETIPASQSEGRILAAATVGCPPAVPIVVCGERIDRQAAACFRYFGVEKCDVVAMGTNFPQQMEYV